MNVNRTRLRQLFNTSEAVVGEQDSAVFVHCKGAQAMAARSVIGGQFGVRRKSVNGSLQVGTDGLGDFGWNG